MAEEERVEHEWKWQIQHEITYQKKRREEVRVRGTESGKGDCPECPPFLPSTYEKKE